MEPDVRPAVIPLGTASALPDADHANAYLAVAAPSGLHWLVDCADSPIPRLMRAGIDPLDVEGLFITHFHPDHIYGLPAWWLGLRMLAHERDFVWHRPLLICARAEVLSQIKALARIFEPQGWLEDLPLVYHEVDAEVGSSVAQTDAFHVTAAPTEHSLPSMAVRFDWRRGEGAFAYSGDTAPCRAVEVLAAGASLLFHEATGEGEGHSSASQAGLVAARAGARRLVLIHIDMRPTMRAAAAAAARDTFGGPVEVAHALRPYRW